MPIWVTSRNSSHSVGKEQKLAWSVPSGLSRLPPAAPTSGCSSRQRTMAMTDSRLMMVSLFRI